MASIFIPQEVVTGFQQIIKLSKKEIEQISIYLINAKVSSQIPKFLTDFERFINSELKLKNPQELVQTITSFTELFNKEENYEVIADNLSKSFKEIYAPNISATEFKALKGNLNQILKSSSNLQLSSKAHKLITENNNLYRKSKVLSDIRLVFNDKMELKNRKAVLIHNLHIVYKSNKDNKDFFVSLDLEDLEDLKDQIERAIKKDKIIKTDYKNIQFI